MFLIKNMPIKAPKNHIFKKIKKRNGRIVPFKKEKISKLNDKLLDLCTENCLLVASVDFSHYQPGALAEMEWSQSQQ